MTVHGDAVFVQIHSDNLERGGNKETVASHAATEVVDGTCTGFAAIAIATGRPQVRFPAANVLGGTLFQGQFVAQEKFILVVYEQTTEFFLNFRQQGHVVHDGGTVFVAVARPAQGCGNLQFVQSSLEGVLDEFLDLRGCEQAGREHGYFSESSLRHRTDSAKSRLVSET